MLFSKAKWNDAEEVQPYVQASSALSFEKCASSFQQAEDKYLLPVLGTSMLNKAIALYAGTPSGVSLQVLKALQSADANLAFYDNFDEFNIRLTDQGIQRQETEKFKQAYKYQENEMKRLYLNRGLNRLELAVKILDDNISDFPEWNSSEYRKARKSLIVRSAQEVSDIYHINNSYIVYLRMVPIIRQITDLELPKVLGSNLCAKLLTALTNGSTYVDDTCKTLSAEELRKSCAKYVVFATLAKLVRQTGSITDRGLYFDSTKSSGTNPDETVPGTSNQIKNMVADLEDTAFKYRRAVQDIVKDCFEAYYGGADCDVYKRDNKGKHTVWL